jgi:4-amino-4-deoxy-L-arabinose transferase-like glycosyltransferase
MTSSRPAWRGFVLLVALAVVWFGTLDYRKLVRPDEGRYAEIPREMVASGDWVTPRLDGLKYFEKPALQYWATAAAYVLFGEHDWTARLWPALTGFLGVLLIAFTGRRLFGGNAGLFAGAVLASSLLFTDIAHFNTLDMGFSFFLALALCAFLLGQDETEAAAKRWRLLMWAALALAVLSKGIAALVLTGGSLVIYTAAQRDLGPWRRLALAWGLPLFLAIAVPWFVAVSLKNPEFPYFFFIHEHFQRFLTTVHGRYQPWWYFIPVFLLGALPWTSVSLHALASAWELDRPGRFAPRRFLVVWTLFVFVFFSVSDSKLVSYILPMFPALALLTGEFLARCRWRTLYRHLLPIAVLAVAAAALAPQVGKLGEEDQPTALLVAYGYWLVAAAIVWLLGTLGALWLLRSVRVRAAVLVMATASGCAGLAVLLGHESLAPSNSGYGIAQEIKPLLKPGVPFYSVGTYDQTLPFYLDRTVTLAAYQDEFVFGMEQEPKKALPTIDDFRRHWLADRDAFALMTRGDYQALAAAGLPMRVVASDPHQLVVRKQ